MGKMLKRSEDLLDLESKAEALSANAAQFKASAVSTNCVHVCVCVCVLADSRIWTLKQRE